MAEVAPPTPFALKCRSYLRKHPTPTERRFLKFLKLSSIPQDSYVFQEAIGKYVVDFWVPSVRVAIEIDGLTHFPKRDAARDKDLQSLGVDRTIHIPNHVIWKNVNQAINIFLKITVNPNAGGKKRRKKPGFVRDHTPRDIISITPIVPQHTAPDDNPELQRIRAAEEAKARLRFKRWGLCGTKHLGLGGIRVLSNQAGADSQAHPTPPPSGTVGLPVDLQPTTTTDLQLCRAN